MVSRLLKSCATPPVNWPTASIFCDWRSASSPLRRSVMSIGFRHRADDGAMLIAQRAHREVEIALADRQMQPHLGLHLFAPHDGDEGIANGVAHAVGGGEPGRLPERLADDVTGLGANARQRRLVGIEHVAVMVEQPLILVAGLEDRAHLRFVGFELRGSLGDAQFQRLVQPAQLDLRLLWRR